MAAQLKCFDSVHSLYQGQNGGVTPRLVLDKQYAKGINVVCRGGLITPRPGYKAVDLIFATQHDYDLFTYGRFQGAEEYQVGNKTYHVVAVNGTIFIIDPLTGQVGNISAETACMDEFAKRLYFCQAEQYFIIQDGINTPIILDGLAARLADHTASEIPVGTIMKYGHGRIFVKTLKFSFLAGDIYMPNNPGTVLLFTETVYWNGGGAFCLPVDLGEITGMEFTQDFDTGTGAGPLVVFAEHGWHSYDVFKPRMYWQDQDIGKVQMRGSGNPSTAGIAVVHDDLMFMSWLGPCSYKLMKAENTQRRRFTRLWQEIGNVMKAETSWIMPFASAVLFNDRLLFTMVGEKCWAKSIDNDDVPDYRFRSIASLDLSPMSGMSNMKDEVGAAWDGVWTGIKPTQLIAGLYENVNRCFAYTKDESNRNLLYEIVTDRKYDCEDKKINCRLYTGLLSFVAFEGAFRTARAVQYMFKRLKVAKLWVDSFSGDVDIKLYCRPDSTTEYGLISSMSISAPQMYAPAPEDVITTGYEQTRSYLQFPEFDRTITDIVLNKALTCGFEFQFLLEWDGYMQLSRLDFEANEHPALPNMPTAPTSMQTSAPRDDYDYAAACNFLNFREMLAVQSLQIGTAGPAYIAIRSSWFPSGTEYVVIVDTGEEDFVWEDEDGNTYEPGDVIPMPEDELILYPVPTTDSPASVPATVPVVPATPLGPTVGGTVVDVPVEAEGGATTPEAYPASIAFAGGSSLLLRQVDSIGTHAFLIKKLQEGPLASVADMTYKVAVTKSNQWPADASILVENADGAEHGPISSTPTSLNITVNTAGMAAGNTYPFWITLTGIHATGTTTVTELFNVGVQPAGEEISGVEFRAAMVSTRRDEVFAIEVTAYNIATGEVATKQTGTLCLDMWSGASGDVVTIGSQTDFENGSKTVFAIISGGGGQNNDELIIYDCGDMAMNGTVIVSLEEEDPVLREIDGVQTKSLQGDSEVQTGTLAICNDALGTSTMAWNARIVSGGAECGVTIDKTSGFVKNGECDYITYSVDPTFAADPGDCDTVIEICDGRGNCRQVTIKRSIYPVYVGDIVYSYTYTNWPTPGSSGAGTITKAWGPGCTAVNIAGKMFVVNADTLGPGPNFSGPGVWAAHYQDATYWQTATSWEKISFAADTGKPSGGISRQLWRPGSPGYWEIGTVSF